MITKKEIIAPGFLILRGAAVVVENGWECSGLGLMGRLRVLFHKIRAPEGKRTSGRCQYHTGR